MILVNLMSRNNFTNYSGEWWHYTLRSEPYPDTYFDFPIQKECSA
jgi:D-alanyl-D-alanine dipeptidase